jgi:hypothetical protein
MSECPKHGPYAPSRFCVGCVREQAYEDGYRDGESNLLADVSTLCDQLDIDVRLDEHEFTAITREITQLRARVGHDERMPCPDDSEPPYLNPMTALWDPPTLEIMGRMPWTRTDTAAVIGLLSATLAIILAVVYL